MFEALGQTLQMVFVTLGIGGLAGLATRSGGCTPRGRAIRLSNRPVLLRAQPIAQHFIPADSVHHFYLRDAPPTIKVVLSSVLSASFFPRASWPPLPPPGSWSRTSSRSTRLIESSSRDGCEPDEHHRHGDHPRWRSGRWILAILCSSASPTCSATAGGGACLGDFYIACCHQRYNLRRHPIAVGVIIVQLAQLVGNILACRHCAVEPAAARITVCCHTSMEKLFLIPST